MNDEEIDINKIHIILCSYGRIHNIPKILNSLNYQSVADNIHLHILNNNKDDVDILNNIVRQNNKINITLKHLDNSQNVFIRFIYAKELAHKGVEYVIFIDDDMLYEQNWVKNMYSIKEKKTFITWYIKIYLYNKKQIDYNLKSSENCTRLLLNYSNDSTLRMKHMLNNSYRNKKYGNYGGPGGSIIDTDIFKNENFFVLPNDDVKIMDDIWISYQLIRMKWRIKRSFLPPIPINDKKTQKVALYNKIKIKKNYFFNSLLCSEA